MTKRNLAHRLTGLGALAAALVAAQSPRPGLRSDPEAPIVVTGTPVTRAEARARAVQFVRQVGVARGEIPAARWVDPICLRVLGIADHYAGIVDARMREIAQTAGVRLARGNCMPNVKVSFVGDAPALLQEIALRSPTRLQEVRNTEREALLNGDAPVRWWYLTEIRSRHSMRNAPQSVQTAAGGQEGGGSSSVTSSTLDVESLSHYNSSIISTQGNRAIIDANVVVDLDRVEGQSLEAVAAYAAFVAFAEVRPSAPAPTGSILGMFDTPPNMRGLTDWDMAFLRGLYRLPLDRGARRHRGILVREMVGFQTGG